MKEQTFDRVVQSYLEFIDKEIVHAGEVWRVIGVGTQERGSTFCHLVNLTRSRPQRNGSNPIQIGDWVDTEVLKAACK
jgi:hypothetical protein